MPLTLEHERRGRRSGESQQDGLHRQQHSDALAVGPGRCAVNGGHAVRHRVRWWQPVGDRRHRVQHRRRTGADVFGRERAGAGERDRPAHVSAATPRTTPWTPRARTARSTTSTWSLKIGQPTVVGIAFDKLVGLRCHPARVRVKVPGHWITVRRHGKRVKVKTRARTRVERVMRCHPRTVRRRTVVFVRVRRHGHCGEGQADQGRARGCAAACYRQDVASRSPSDAARPSTGIWAPPPVSRSAVTP